MNLYEPVIGLEVHVQLNTKTKIFCNCSTDNVDAKPNVNICPVCSGQPGVLPVLNEKVLNFAIKTGLALNCEIAKITKFDRKNYFYPDLPKGYQISQYDLPICKNGYININDSINGGIKKVRIKRIHMEEDAGKIIHDNVKNISYVDYNRAGIPLLEIVTEPDIKSAVEAKEYLEKLKLILKYIDVSDCNMEDGSLRCDVNISLKPVNSEKLFKKVEIKNLNSFKSVQKAIETEIKRQTEIYSSGKCVEQETRCYDEQTNSTKLMRKKEGEEDYRYFPEPDLPFFYIDESKINNILQSIPALPDEKFNYYVNNLGLSQYDANVIVNNYSLTVFFDECIKAYNNYKHVVNWLLGDISKKLNEIYEENIFNTKIRPSHLIDLLNAIDSGLISGKIAKSIIDEIFKTGDEVKQIIQKLKLVQITDHETIKTIVDEVISENKNAVNDYINGKNESFTFLIGQIMKKTKGKANPNIANQILKEKLENLK